VLEKRQGAWKYLKVFGKSSNLNLKYVANFHFITILKQTLVCILPELIFRLLAEEKETWNVNWHWIPHCFCQSVSIKGRKFLWHEHPCEIKCDAKKSVQGKDYQYYRAGEAVGIQASSAEKKYKWAGENYSGLTAITPKLRKSCWKVCNVPYSCWQDSVGKNIFTTLQILAAIINTSTLLQWSTRLNKNGLYLHSPLWFSYVFVGYV